MKLAGGIEIPVFTKRPEMVAVPVLFMDADDTIRKGYGTTGKFVNRASDISLFDDIGAGVYRWLHASATSGLPDTGGRPQVILAIVSNQAGVESGELSLHAAGEVSLETAQMLNKHVDRACSLYGNSTPYAVVHAFSPQKESPSRKPGVGMAGVVADRMMMHWSLVPDWEASMMVGDLESDQKFAEALGLNFSWAKDFFAREEPEQ